MSALSQAALPQPPLLGRTQTQGRSQVLEWPHLILPPHFADGETEAQKRLFYLWNWDYSADPLIPSPPRSGQGASLGDNRSVPTFTPMCYGARGCGASAKHRLYFPTGKANEFQLKSQFQQDGGGCLKHSLRRTPAPLRRNRKECQGPLVMSAVGSRGGVGSDSYPPMGDWRDSGSEHALQSLSYLPLPLPNCMTLGLCISSPGFHLFIRKWESLHLLSVITVKIK